jgi:hypothetical protein
MNGFWAVIFEIRIWMKKKELRNKEINKKN